MDLDMLKAIAYESVEKHAIWTDADQAVSNVLDLVREQHAAGETGVYVQDVYDAIKSAYVGDADWGDE